MEEIQDNWSSDQGREIYSDVQGGIIGDYFLLIPSFQPTIE